MKVIGVTGTDGKTTTSNLVFQILLAASIPAGIISTVNAVIGEEVIDTGFHVTTPEAPEIQQYLSRMLSSGLTHVVLETTSHGLAQDRVTGTEFDIGIVTNITHEHLDFHGSYENYRAAKGRLFSQLGDYLDSERGSNRLAVLNKDDSSIRIPCIDHQNTNCVLWVRFQRGYLGGSDCNHTSWHPVCGQV